VILLLLMLRLAHGQSPLTAEYGIDDSQLHRPPTGEILYDMACAEGDIECEPQSIIRQMAKCVDEVLNALMNFRNIAGMWNGGHSRSI
jgi:hypothetical protein